MNAIKLCSLACLGTLLIAASLSAQLAQQQPVVVQQPVFEFFTTNTTVTVPDGGQALLGGVDSARFGSTSRGVPMLGKLPGVGRLFNNRAIGSEVNASRNSVRARIIDLREMDEAILGSGASSSGAYPAIVRNAQGGFEPVQRQNDATVKAARFLSHNVGRRGGAQPSASSSQPVEPAVPVSRARALLAKGDAALAAGKIELATRYFRAAERIADEMEAPGAARVTKRQSDAGGAEPALVLGDER